MSLREEFNKILATKEAIRQSIISKGVNVSPDDVFSSYPEKIMQIKTISENVVEWRAVTTYESIPFTTIRENDSSLSVGVEEVRVKGADGSTQVIVEYEYINGVASGVKREVSRSEYKSMTPQRIAVGTKQNEEVVSNILKQPNVKASGSTNIFVEGVRTPEDRVPIDGSLFQIKQWAAPFGGINIYNTGLKVNKAYTLAFKFKPINNSVKDALFTMESSFSGGKHYFEGKEVTLTSFAGEHNFYNHIKDRSSVTYYYQFKTKESIPESNYMQVRFMGLSNNAIVDMSNLGLYEGHINPFDSSVVPPQPNPEPEPEVEMSTDFKLEPYVAPSTTKTTISTFNTARTVNLVDDFGAVGDGITDNFNALKSAIKASSKEPLNIVIPKGKFYYRGPNNARMELWPDTSKGIRLKGESGAILLPDHNRTSSVYESYVMQLTFSDDSLGFCMENLTIDGINAPQDIYHSMPNATNITVPTLRGIVVNNAKDIVVYNTTFKNIFGGYTILAERYDRVDLNKVTLERCGGNAWTESFGGALYFSGHVGDAIININDVHATGYTDPRYPHLLGWIGIIFENGSTQSSNPSQWLVDKNTYFNITNSSFLDYETGWHVETVAGNTYWNSDNVLYRVDNYAIVAALWGEIKEASNRIKTKILPFGRTGLIKGMYYSEKEASKNESGLNDFNMYNSVIDVVDVQGYSTPYQILAYGDSVHGKYYNTTFNNIGNSLVANGSATVFDSEINLSSTNTRTDHQLHNSDFSKPGIQKVQLTRTGINRGIKKVAPLGSVPPKVRNTGYVAPPMTGPLGPATLERER